MNKYNENMPMQGDDDFEKMDECIQDLFTECDVISAQCDIFARKIKNFVPKDVSKGNKLEGLFVREDNILDMQKIFLDAERVQNRHLESLVKLYGVLLDEYAGMIDQYQSDEIVMSENLCSILWNESINEN